MAVLQTLLTLGCFCLIQADYFISSAKYDRENSTDECSLATPEIRFSENGTTVVLNTTHFPGGEKLWIGYALELNTFLYLGCSNPDDIKDNATMSNIYKKDLGQCYSFCKTRFFGMQESNCYCIYSPPKNIGSKNCKSTCDNPKDTLCGQKGNETDVSVYMTVNDTSDSKSNGQYCQAVQRSSEHSNFSWNYVWEACDTSLEFICQNGSFTESNQHFRAIGVEGNWQNSMTLCIAFDEFPTEKIDIIDQDIQVSGYKDTQRRWIGKIRSFVIKKTEDKSNLNHLDVQKGYIELSDDKVNLKFEPYFGEPLHALCKQEHVTTLTFLSTTKSSGGSTEGWYTRKWGIGVLVLIGVIGVIVLILLILLIAFVIRTILRWIRRHTVGKRDDHDSARSTNTFINRSYSDGNVQQKKSVNKNAVVKVAKINAVNDEYDTTTNLRLKANITYDDTGNIYNKLEDVPHGSINGNDKVTNSESTPNTSG